MPKPHCRQQQQLIECNKGMLHKSRIFLQAAKTMCLSIERWHWRKQVCSAVEVMALQVPLASPAILSELRCCWSSDDNLLLGCFSVLFSASTSDNVSDDDLPAETRHNCFREPRSAAHAFRGTHSVSTGRSSSKQDFHAACAHVMWADLHASHRVVQSADLCSTSNVKPDHILGTYLAWPLSSAWDLC